MGGCCIKLQCKTDLGRLFPLITNSIRSRVRAGGCCVKLQCKTDLGKLLLLISNFYKVGRESGLVLYQTTI